MHYWLAPNGRVWATEIVGGHCDLAFDIIDLKFNEILNEYGIPISSGFDPIDFLERKGYIRYMGWSETPHWIIYHQKPTRQQKNKMFELTGFEYEKP